METAHQGPPPSGSTIPPESSGTASSAPPPPGAADSQRKRSRGRPPGSRSAGPLPPEQPVPPESAAPGEEPRTRRRRKQALDKDAVAQEVFKAHILIAKWTKQPLLQVDENEARILASAIDALCREFDIELSGKSGAVTQVIYALLIVYGPRIPAFQEVMERAKRAARSGPVTVEGTATEANGAATSAPAH